MKKLLLLFLLIFATSPVFAKTIHVQAMENFSTENPPQNYSVRILDDLSLEEKLILKIGYVVNGKIIDVTDPKRLKRDAKFVFVPLDYVDENNEKHEIKGFFPAVYTTKLNKGEIAKTAALGVGSYFVKGLSIAYSAVEGALKNEKDNRFKSSATAVYEDSPFSYVEKGHEIVLEKDQVFLLNFKIKDEAEKAPNYEYTMPDTEQDNSNSQESSATSNEIQ